MHRPPLAKGPHLDRRGGRDHLRDMEASEGMIRFIDIRNGEVRAARLPGWAVALGGAAALAVGLAVLVLGVGLLLVLAPIAIGGALIARWRLRKALREARTLYAERQARDGVIEGDFRVIDDGRTDDGSRR
ncbi:hypothetical protein NK718_02150 [Alsobacter sp. SYSU M60028]|uniref:Uncharacterized protein n=1 Tax=Alsobacter ponti TaxID=2962936 RepID=A0ABT1L772_9HYPH|nr:hypothetical protein [Alsobacter ponti]MCP8937305.1 hypothetical protein [Alsobacter ponti]